MVASLTRVVYNPSTFGYALWDTTLKAQAPANAALLAIGFTYIGTKNNSAGNDSYFYSINYNSLKTKGITYYELNITYSAPTVTYNHRIGDGITGSAGSYALVNPCTLGIVFTFANSASLSWGLLNHTEARIITNFAGGGCLGVMHPSILNPSWDENSYCIGMIDANNNFFSQGYLCGLTPGYTGLSSYVTVTHLQVNNLDPFSNRNISPILAFHCPGGGSDKGLAGVFSADFGACYSNGMTLGDTITANGQIWLPLSIGPSAVCIRIG